MPHWLAVTVTIAASFATLVGAAAAARKVFRALRDGWRQLLELLGRIEVASEGIAALNRSLHELAGSFVGVVKALMERQDEQARQLGEISERIDTMAELFTDLNADIGRHTKESRDVDNSS